MDSEDVNFRKYEETNIQTLSYKHSPGATNSLSGISQCVAVSQCSTKSKVLASLWARFWVASWPRRDGRPRSPPFLFAVSAPAQPDFFFPFGRNFQGLVLERHDLVGLLGEVRPVPVCAELLGQVFGGLRGLLELSFYTESLARGLALHRRRRLVGRVHLLQQLLQPHAAPELLHGAALVVHQLGVAHRPPPYRNKVHKCKSTVTTETMIKKLINLLRLFTLNPFDHNFYSF